MRKLSKIRLEVAGETNQGFRRTNNQDSIFLWASDQDLYPPRALLLMADGMGGHQEGDIASRIVVEKHKEILLPMLSSEEITEINLFELLLGVLNKSNQAIYDFANDKNIIPQDIGTTLDCVVILGTEMYISHIGDGRVYIINQFGLEQLSKDHSLVAEMIEADILEPEAVYTHPQRNILTHALGGNSKLEAQIQKFIIAIGERVLICSDGLWGKVRDKLIERILLWASPPHVLVKELIVAANEAGGNDNISVIICDILPTK